MRALTADYDVTTYAWKFNLPACMRLWPFYFWVVSTGDTGLGLGRVNLVCVATERSLLTTSTLLQQVKNKHFLHTLCCAFFANYIEEKQPDHSASYQLLVPNNGLLV